MRAVRPDELTSVVATPTSKSPCSRSWFPSSANDMRNSQSNFLMLVPPSFHAPSPFESVLLTSDPHATSKRTQLGLPLVHASRNAVFSSLSIMLASAPRSSKSLTMASYPPDAASISAVRLLTPSMALTSTPMSRYLITTSWLPLFAPLIMYLSSSGMMGSWPPSFAKSRPDLPSPLRLVISQLFSSSASTQPMCPVLQHTWKTLMSAPSASSATASTFTSPSKNASNLASSFNLPASISPSSKSLTTSTWDPSDASAHPVFLAFVFEPTSHPAFISASAQATWPPAQLAWKAVTPF